MTIKNINTTQGNLEGLFALINCLGEDIPKWVKDYKGVNESCVGLFEEDSLKAFILYRATDKSCEIMYLATEVQSRKKGFMKELMTQFTLSKLQGSSAATFEEVWLEVSEKNSPAIALYNSMGFKQVGVRESYYKDRSSALVMSLSLN